jgi:hypothetical protein
MTHRAISGTQSFLIAEATRKHDQRHDDAREAGNEATRHRILTEAGEWAALAYSLENPLTGDKQARKVRRVNIGRNVYTVTVTDW